MARKTKEVTITAEGRDQGKVFFITEMPALQAERWGMRAIMLLAAHNVDIGEIGNGGMQKMLTLGFEALAQVPYEQVAPLMDELMACCQIRVRVGEQVITRPIIAEEVEEAWTFVTLKGEAFGLHVGFSFSGALSTSKAAPGTTTDSIIPASPNTSTAPQPSVTFSQQARTKRGR